VAATRRRRRRAPSVPRSTDRCGRGERVGSAHRLVRAEHGASL